MSRHLPVLMAKFPDKVMLNVDDIASLTDYSKGHIYNLACAKKLPFKLADALGDKIQVSIVEMADYLDDKLLTKSSNGPTETPAEPKRKVGRPRGTTKAALAMRCFQAELRTAIYQHEINDIFAVLRRQSEGVAVVTRDDASCTELQQEMRTSMLHHIGHAFGKFEEIEIQFSLQF